MQNTGKDMSSTDKSLLRRFQTGDDDAATALYARYANRLLALAQTKTSSNFKSRFDADDVVQSVFRSFFRRAKQGLYDVPAGGELWQLLLVLSLNKIRRLALHHSAQKRNVRMTVSGEEVLPNVSAPEEATALGILQQVVDQEIGELPDIQQRIVRDRIEGIEISEIARRVDRSKRTVERTLQQFRQRLAKVIDNG
jgi:RNA polymerase sigma-70 factor (ECF subfamily)